MLRVTFLGTASSRPTVRRNVSSIGVHREGVTYLFDCGEGTQRQMMRFGIGFRMDEIFITHLHADHYLGVTGLLRTMSLQGRQEPMVLWAPPRGGELLRQAVELGGDRLLFPVRVREMAPGRPLERDGHRIVPFRTRHTGRSVGLVLEEEERLGRFDPERAAELGVPEGPLFGRLHRGEPIELPDGTSVEPHQVVGPPRPGRKLVYTGDTRPCEATVEAAAEADLLVHEATFGDEETERADETGHSTARQAARIAQEAGVLRLALTHFSARYSELAHLLGEEASELFDDPIVAEDGLEVEIPYRDPQDAPGDEGGGQG